MSAKEEQISQNDPNKLKIKELRDLFLLRGILYVIQLNKRIIAQKTIGITKTKKKFKSWKEKNFSLTPTGNCRSIWKICLNMKNLKSLISTKSQPSLSHGFRPILKSSHSRETLSSKDSLDKSKPNNSTLNSTKKRDR